MKLDLSFTENNKEFKLDFGQIQDLSDGGYERGYERGKADEQKITSSILDGTIEGEYYNDKIITVRPYAFNGIPNITSISLPNVTTVSSRSFSQCKNLVNIDLPKLEKMPTYAGLAFSNLDSLKVLNLHNCKQIAGVQVNYCPNLKTIIITTPEVCVATSSNAFGTLYTPVGNGKGYIYVPDNLVEEYRQSTNWQGYNFKPLSELPEEVEE